MMDSSAPPQPPPGYLPTARWRIWDVVLAVAAGLIAALVVSVAVLAAGADVRDPIPFTIVFVAQFGGSMAVVVALAKRRGSGSLAADVGLHLRLRDWWGVPAGMALGIAVALVMTPLLILLFGDDPPTQGVVEIAGSSETAVEQLMIIVSVAVLAPIVEEIIYRGMLLNVLIRRFSVWPSIVVSAALFAMVHVFLDLNAIAALVGLFLLGLVFGWVSLRRGDISLAIALHSGVNLLAAIQLLWGDDLIEWSERRLEEIEGIVAFLPF